MNELRRWFFAIAAILVVLIWSQTCLVILARREIQSLQHMMDTRP